MLKNEIEKIIKLKKKHKKKVLFPWTILYDDKNSDFFSSISLC